MNTRPKLVLAALLTCTTLLAGCNSSPEDRLAEPEISFPAKETSTSPAPDDDDEDATETETSTSTKTSTSTSKKSSSSSSSSSSSKKSSSSASSSDDDSDEPAPVQPAEPAPQNGATCAWPKQGQQSASDEYSTFCDGDWARTVMPNGQEYFWASNGNSLASGDPVGEHEGNACWDRKDFTSAPAAVRDAVPYCP